MAGTAQALPLICGGCGVTFVAAAPPQRSLPLVCSRNAPAAAPVRHGKGPHKLVLSLTEGPASRSITRLLPVMCSASPFQGVDALLKSTVCMAPDDEKMTRRSPLDFPVEWDRPTPGRRPDIFPQFSPMKTPLPPPLPTDPPEEDEEDEEKKEEDPDKEDKPEE